RPAAVQIDDRLSETAAGAGAPAALRRILPVLPGPGPVPGRRGGLGAVEQDDRPAVQADAAGRRKFHGPARTVALDLDVAARAGPQLPFPADLRTIERLQRLTEIH